MTNTGEAVRLPHLKSKDMKTLIICAVLLMAALTYTIARQQRIIELQDAVIENLIEHAEAQHGCDCPTLDGDTYAELLDMKH